MSPASEDRRGSTPLRPTGYASAVVEPAPKIRSEDELAEEVLRSIRRIVRRVSEHSRLLSREAGLTVPQLLCLKAIGSRDGQEVTVNMVGAEVQLSPATVSRIVDRLERGGLVLRERTAKDRRKVCLSLTPAGLERFQTLPKPLQVRFVERLGKLEPHRAQVLLDALHEVVQLMEADDLDASPMLTPGEDLKAE